MIQLKNHYRVVFTSSIFTSNLVCFGDTTTLTSTSVAGNYPSGDINSWSWNFTNENNDTILNVFSNCNDTAVTLTVTDINGCQRYFSK